MLGKADKGVIVNGAVPLIWKTILSAPALVLAESSACRKDPAPLSAVLITEKVLPQLD
jgi:hypothetical protein